MMFQVEIEVRIPAQIDRETVDRLGRLEHERAAELQRAGKWQHLWRVVGRFANLSIFEVESNDELHAILESLPFYPYMNIEVTPLCRHPGALRTQPTLSGEILKNGTSA
jgi:muconolactone D-isomerase